MKSKDPTSYLARYSPKGSRHLVEPTWVTHLLRVNCHCEFRCGMHLANGSVKGPEKHWEVATAIARELRQHAPTRTTNNWNQLIGRNWVKIRLAGSELSQLLWRRRKPHWKKIWIAGTLIQRPRSISQNVIAVSRLRGCRTMTIAAAPCETEK